MGRTAMLKEVTARATVDRDVGGSDRGMSLATKASLGSWLKTKMMQSSVIATCAGQLLLK